MARILVCCLVVGVLILMDDIQAQKKNQTIDLAKLAKLLLRPSFQTRVIGGHVTTIDKLGGYLVAMRYYNNFICGGTLVRDLIVLTAAHCFENRDVKDGWSVEGGISRLTDRGVRRGVKGIIKSADFRMATMNMDVAVVLLSRPMVGKNIGTLTLCTTPLTTGKHLVVSGWGMTHPDNNGPDQLLRTVTVPVIEKRFCRDVYRLSAAITDSMFCASVLGKKDACTYDSGGPLVYDRQVCGIVSFGIGCASRRYPGVYTDVHYVKPFIEKGIKALLSRRSGRTKIKAPK
ncbi:seminase [Drosophila subpulchrella]|uniref:seminase n=1 Tax=Drosophila subpulchrella TaxID=1486046 RepID=UPI0018A131C7|nr:seminase [Drosophila subpulchrella]